MTALGIVCCYIMGRSLAWNWLSLVSCVFLVLFTFGLYYIPESPPWLVYNEEEDLAFRSMSQIRGDEYDASKEIGRIKEILEAHNHNINAVTALESSEEEILTIGDKFGIKALFKKPVLKPFLLTLIVTVLLQFTGQGSLTFYTIQIFTVRKIC